jgi:glycosyltransferase involved in cell wall biosynthesis
MSAIHTAPSLESHAPARAAKGLRLLAWPIDPANPYTAELYTDMGKDVEVDAFSPGKMRSRYDAWHVHWPEALLNIPHPARAAFKLSSFLAMIDLVRMRGGKIVWTVHNLRAHEGLHPRLEAIFWRRFVPRVDGVISLSRTGLALACERFHRLRYLPAAVIPHGHYRHQYPPCEVDARKALGIAADARVILFFGEVRAYKNVEALVAAFAQVHGPNAVLLVAGRPRDSALAAAISRQAAADSRVRLSLGFIDRADVSKYFAAADLVVLPYRQILNSGAALLALSFNRPVLVPGLGSMYDLQEDFGPGWVQTFSSELDPAALEQALEWAAEPRPSICPMPDRYRWTSIRTETVRFYREVIAAS